MHRLQSEFRTLREITGLTYELFEAQVAELNDLCRSQLAGQPAYLEFSVRQLPPPHLALFWKPLVRVECRKLEAPGGRLLSARLLNLRQLISLRRDLCLLSQLPTPASSSTDSACASHRQDLTASVVLSFLSDDEAISGHSSKGGGGMVLVDHADKPPVPSGGASATASGAVDPAIEECCICMDRQADVLLECAHAYCQPCIRRWLEGRSPEDAAAARGEMAARTCPLCRTLVASANDGWVIATPPRVAQGEAAELMLGAAGRAGRAI